MTPATVTLESNVVELVPLLFGRKLMNGVVVDALAGSTRPGV